MILKDNFTTLLDKSKSNIINNKYTDYISKLSNDIKLMPNFILYGPPAGLAARCRKHFVRRWIVVDHPWRLRVDTLSSLTRLILHHYALVDRKVPNLKPLHPIDWACGKHRHVLPQV